MNPPDPEPKPSGDDQERSNNNNNNNDLKTTTRNGTKKEQTDHQNHHKKNVVVLDSLLSSTIESQQHTIQTTTPENTTVPTTPTSIQVSNEQKVQYIYEHCCNLYWYCVRHIPLEYFMMILIVLLSIVIMNTNHPMIQFTLYWLYYPMYQLLLRILGTSIGIGFGLGFATYIYDTFYEWNHKQQQIQQQLAYNEQDPNNNLQSNRSLSNHYYDNISSRKSGMMMMMKASKSVSSVNSSRRSTSITNNHNTTTNFGYLEDDQTYQSLMKSAGYTIIIPPPNQQQQSSSSLFNDYEQEQRTLQWGQHLRGQVVRTTTPTNQSYQQPYAQPVVPNRLYNFTETRFHVHDPTTTTSQYHNKNKKDHYDFSDHHNSDNDDDDDSDEEDEVFNEDNSHGIRKKKKVYKSKIKPLPRPLAMGVKKMIQLWPTLPLRINEELGRCIEYMIRDFVAIWYTKMDYGCIVDVTDNNNNHSGDDMIEDQNPNTTTTTTTDNNNESVKAPVVPQSQQNHNHNQRMMLYSLAQYRTLPFMDYMYEAMSIVFGNLATRIENINVFELLLLKWIPILTHTFKVYRLLRKNAIQQVHQQQRLQQLQNQQNGTTVQPQRQSSFSNNNISTVEGTIGHEISSTEGIQQQQQPKNASSIARRTFSLRQSTTTPQTLITDTIPNQRQASMNISTTTTQQQQNHNTDMDLDSTQTTLPPTYPKRGGGGGGAAGGGGTATGQPYVPVSEMAMTKEFLFANKLHKAVTFGLDVPSLLFADSSGKECGIPPPLNNGIDVDVDPISSVPNPNKTATTTTTPDRDYWTDDDVLERRLFHTPILRDCELDYNRVLGHRIVRTLIPRMDYSSLIVRTLLTEIMSGCVITPIMGLFSPDYINSWIIMGLKASSSSSTTATSQGTTKAAASNTTTTAPTPTKTVSSKAKTSNTTTTSATATVSTTGTSSTVSRNTSTTTTTIDDNSTMTSVHVTHTESIQPSCAGDDNIEIIQTQPSSSFRVSAVDSDVKSRSMDDLNNNSAPHVEGATPGTIENCMTDSADAPSLLNETINTAELSNLDESILPTAGVPSIYGGGIPHAISVDTIYTHLAMSLIDLQGYVDFDECRNARMNNIEYRVDWDIPECRAAVVRLVLVIEAALSHGRCTYHQNRHRRQRPLICRTMSSSGDDEGENIISNNKNNVNSNDENEDTGDDDVDDIDSVDIDHIDVKEDGEGDGPVEVTLSDYESLSLSQILMELTSDIDSFEERVEAECNPERESLYAQKYGNMIAEVYEPSAQEQSTMRTLIAAWLHTGQVYRAVALLMKAHATILAPYYHEHAFLRNQDQSSGFTRQLLALVDIAILVDTMAVLACPRLDDSNQEALTTYLARPGGKHNNTTTSSQAITTPSGKKGDENGTRSPTLINYALMASTAAAQSPTSSSGIPRYLDFNRNESFAASLRSERERRMASWERLMNQQIYGTVGYNEGLPIVCRSVGRGTIGTDEDDILIQKDLHHVARMFYTSTSLIAIRDAARRKLADPTRPMSPTGTSNTEIEASEHSETGDGTEILQPVSLVILEATSPRRRLEVPDDDSSFLLRAQPRALNAVGVHRDLRNHDQSFKSFAATYEEPALPAVSSHYTGGRYIRRCLIRYYPIDRTATVLLPNEPARKLDQRKRKNVVPDTITLGQSMLSSSRQAPYLSPEYLRERHLCNRWIPKGTTRTQSILASNVMEPTDFTSTPRSGKAFDFVYRMNFYERPMLDLGGKHFTVHDSTSLGVHRADASALEVSDASISAALLCLGSDEKFAYYTDTTARRPMVEMGKDGYPVLWMKFTRKQDDAHVEVKPYRTSFVRAALMITAARQEAQLQCLIRCVRDGSAKQASKALTDATLKPTIKLLEYASSRSRENQSLIQRDLKLGVNHIDEGQLRRNGLLLPRYPTSLLDLTALVEDVVQPTEVKGVNNIFGAASTVFRIRCIATVSLIATNEELEGDESYRNEDGTLGKVFREEWIIYRTMKDFQSLHKHLKGEVSPSESSGTAGSRLVGAATAAFTATNTIPGRQRQKKLLIPSLSQASKAGALGGTKKLNAKRKEILDTYLAYLLSPGHPIAQCTELLLFLGAFYPFPPYARVGGTVVGDSDPLGRTEMLRTIINKRPTDSVSDNSTKVTSVSRSVRGSAIGGSSIAASETEDEMLEDFDEPEEPKGPNKVDMIPSIRSKVDRVQLSQVRNRLFELLRYQFGFENASFIRNRMLQALKTASFAVTSPAEFQRTLYKLHVEHLNADALGGWIKMLCDILWPNGVFFTSAPPTSAEELRAQATSAKESLHSSFPAEVRAILGQELTRDGLDIFHEMLQNRLVLKSMSYMLFDLLWLEVFPEIGDILPCGSVLDLET